MFQKEHSAAHCPMEWKGIGSNSIELDPFNGPLPVNYFSIFRYLSESSWKYIFYGKTKKFAGNRFNNNI